MDRLRPGLIVAMLVWGAVTFLPLPGLERNITPGMQVAASRTESPLRRLQTSLHTLSPDMYAGIPEGHPVDSVYPLTSPFGVRIHPVLNASMMHQGLDFGAPEGAPVRATADGVVRYTTGVLDSSSYGISVVLEHPVSPVMPDTFTTLYAHLSQARVWRGKKVKRGDIIGYVGNTGRSTDFHLHYEVHINGKPVDPAEFVLPEGQKPVYPPAITARRKTKGNQG